MKRTAVAGCAALIAAFLLTSSVAAEIPQQFTYERSSLNWVREVPTPDVFSHSMQVGGIELGVGAFDSPKDIYVTNRKAYILDSGNNRIVVCDKGFKSAQVISEFSVGGKIETFKLPEGVFVDQGGTIYVADTGNERIVVLKESGDNYIITLPESDQIRKDSKFQPTRVASDGKSSIYVVSRGIYEGILTFDQNGEFTGFLGTAKVRYTLWELFWKRVMPRQAQSGMKLFVPTEYTSITIDQNGFLYTASANYDIDKYIKSMTVYFGIFKANVSNVEYPVKQLGPDGTDISIREGPLAPVGDVLGALNGEPSLFEDIGVSESGFFAVVDRRSGRIFTYDVKGNLVVSFGGTGTEKGMFIKPVSVEADQNNIYVVDEKSGMIEIFAVSEYGQMILDASDAYAKGDYQKSKELWTEVQSGNVFCELAYTGLGKVSMRENDYKSAMNYFLLAKNKTYYSESLIKYRESMAAQNFLVMLFVILLVAAALLISFRKIYAYSLKNKPGIASELSYSLYTIAHPFEAFWEIRFMKRAGLKSAGLLFTGFVLLQLTAKMNTGFLFNEAPVTKSSFNPVMDAGVLLGIFAVACVANWMVSIILNGIGRLKDICVSFAYSLTPMLIGGVTALACSQFLSLKEKLIYYLIFAVSLVFTVFLIFSFHVVCYDSVFKAICAILLTLAAAMVILFTILIFFTMAQQVIGFLISVYSEVRLTL